MSELLDYIERHTRLAGAGVGIDLALLRVQVLGEPDKAAFTELLQRAVSAGGPEVDPLDHAEHSYIELGAWLGSQEHALRLMALGTHLGVWQLLTPQAVLGGRVDGKLATQLAGQGLVTVIAPRPLH